MSSEVSQALHAPAAPAGASSCRPLRPLTYLVLLLELFVVSSAVIVAAAPHWFKINGTGVSVGLTTFVDSQGYDVSNSTNAFQTKTVFDSLNAAIVLISLTAALSGLAVLVLLFRAFSKESCTTTTLQITLSFLAFATYLTGFGAVVNYSRKAGISLSTEWAYGLAIAGWASEFLAFVLLYADSKSDQYKVQLEKDAATATVQKTAPLSGFAAIYRLLVSLFVFISAVIVLTAPHWYYSNVNITAGFPPGVYYVELGLNRFSVPSIDYSVFNNAIALNPNFQSHADRLTAAGFALIVAAALFKGLQIIVSYIRQYYSETAALQKSELALSFFSFATYLAGFGCATHYLNLSFDQHTAASGIVFTAKWHYGYCFGLAIAGWAVAFLSFLGSVPEYRAAVNALPSAVEYKPLYLPNGAAFTGLRSFSFLAQLVVTLSAILVASETHWFNVSDSAGGITFGLYDYCVSTNGEVVCTSYGINDFPYDTVGVQDAALSALSLISIAAIFGGFSLITLYSRFGQDTKTKTQLYNLFNLITFVTFITGFGAAESLKHQLKNAGVHPLQYGFCFGLSIAGWSLAFITQVFAQIEYMAIKNKFTEAAPAPAEKRSKRLLALLATKLALFVAVAAIIVVSSPSWYLTNSATTGSSLLGPSNCKAFEGANTVNKAFGDACGAANTLFALATVFGFIAFLTLASRVYNKESGFAAAWSILLTFVAFSFFLTGFGSMVHLKNNLPADISVSTTKFAYGLAVAGFAAAFISFVLQVADLQSTGFKTQADADGAKPVHVAHTLVLPGYRVFIRVVTRLYVFLTAVIVLVAPHWYINKANNTEVGLVRALTCPTPSTCTILPNSDPAADSTYNGRLVAAGFALIVSAALLEALNLLALFYRTSICESKASKNAELFFSFFTFATYLAGFGCATHLKGFYRYNYNGGLGGDYKLDYGYAFGLAISGWAVAFISTVFLIVASKAESQTKHKPTFVAGKASNGKKALQFFIGTAQVFVIISALIVTAATHWFTNNTYTFGLYKYCAGNTCYTYTYSNSTGQVPSLGKISIQDAGYGGLALISAAIIFAAFSVLALALRTSAGKDTQGLGKAYVIFTFLAFVGYITGFGASERLRHLLKSAGMTASTLGSLDDGYAYGLSIAGWSVAFIVFVLALVEYLTTKYEEKGATVASPVREVALTAITATEAEPKPLGIIEEVKIAAEVAVDTA